MASPVPVRWLRGLFLPLPVGLLLQLSSPDTPELTASQACGHLQQKYGLQLGHRVNNYTLIRCLAAGRTAEIWLARGSAADVAVKIAKFAHEPSRLEAECRQFQKLRLEGVACVPGCLGGGVLELGSIQRPFSVRTLARGRTVAQMLMEGPRVEIHGLRTVLDIVLGIFEVLDSGVHSCARGSACTYHVEVSLENVIVDKKGSVSIVDFDTLGLVRYLKYFEQISLFPPFVSLDVRLQECMTRSLLLALVRTVTLGVQNASLWSLRTHLMWRGSKLDHCRNSGLTEDERSELPWAHDLLLPSWRWDGTKPRDPQQRTQEKAWVELIVELMPREFAAEWLLLSGPSDALVDALVAVRDYDISWPPVLIRQMLLWRQQLAASEHPK